MNILVLNSGSSSVKFALYDAELLQQKFSGQVEGLGTSHAKGIWKGEEKRAERLTGNDHQSALNWIYEQLSEEGIRQEDLLGVGHRVVHGGEKFHKSTLINSENLEELRQISSLAPLHNPANLQGIEAIQTLYPSLENLAVFDTAFHQSMPEKAYLYPVPYELYEEHQIRRYGFHGTSYEYIVTQLENFLEEDSGVIIAHLGNGCSAAAVQSGKGVDTTMGLTPLEGLMMGTRSGTIDPGLHHHMVSVLGWSLDEVHNMLNKKSGLLGLSKLSSDMRDVSEPVPPDAQCKLAMDVYCYKLARELMGICAGLTSFDGIIFTGGVGENSDYVRKKVIEQMKVLGLSIDEEKNLKTKRGASGNIAAQGSKPILVIPTDEEKMIAQKVKTALEGVPA